MIARHDKHTEKADLWSRLAEPVPQDCIAWRQDGKPIARDGKFFARFVAYIEANTVRERLDSVVPGEWDLTLELLPPLPLGEDADNACAFKARLQILGVIREDVGSGKDYKQASTDAFKRAGVRFGIAHELYAYEQNWVQLDGDGKYAKPVEDPGVAYARRFGSGSASTGGSSSARPAERAPQPAPKQETRAAAAPAKEDDGGSQHAPQSTEAIQSCPKCGGKMWDNRLSKRNPKAPDFKCRDRSCDGVVWPPRNAAPAQRPRDDEGDAFPGDPGPSDFPPQLDSSPLGLSADDIPF